MGCMASLYTNCMYNFIQTKLIFRGPVKSAMADSVWSRGGQGRFVQWYAKHAA